MSIGLVNFKSFARMILMILVASPLFALGQEPASTPPGPLVNPEPGAASAASSSVSTTASKPTRSEGAGSDAVLARLRQMEQRLDAMSRQNEQLSRENQRLTEQYQELNNQVQTTVGSSRSAEKGSESATPIKKPTPSGADAFSQIGSPPTEDREASGSGNPASSGGGSKSSGGDPTASGRAQVEGNRRLGKIPLMTYYDFDNDGFRFATKDDEFDLHIRAMTQVDGRVYQQDNQNPVSGGVFNPRSRIYFEGQFSKPITYEFSFQNFYDTVQLLDSYINFNYDKRFQVRFGRYKNPHTYEFYRIHIWHLLAPERSLFANNFEANRRFGVMTHGSLFNSRLEYAVGSFDGQRNSFQEFNNSQDVAAFVNYKPFNNEEGSFLRDFQVGTRTILWYRRSSELRSPPRGPQSTAPLPSTLPTSRFWPSTATSVSGASGRFGNSIALTTTKGSR